jgi:hypothetical protein
VASIGYQLLEQVLSRLTATSATLPTVVANRIRRQHLTTVPRDDAPAVYVVEGEDVPLPAKNEDDCPIPRELRFAVRLFVRDDAGAAIADALRLAVYARLSPDAEGLPAYVGKARIRPGPIRRDAEIADGDALRIDCEFVFLYSARQWAHDVGEE